MLLYVSRCSLLMYAIAVGTLVSKLMELEALGQCIPPPRHVLPVSRSGYPDPDLWSGSLPKFNYLFVGPLPTFPENFMQIRSDVFAQSWQQANKQTENQTTTITYPLGRGNYAAFIRTQLVVRQVRNEYDQRSFSFLEFAAAVVSSNSY